MPLLQRPDLETAVWAIGQYGPTSIQIFSLAVTTVNESRLLLGTPDHMWVNRTWVRLWYSGSGLYVVIRGRHIRVFDHEVPIRQISGTVPMFRSSNAKNYQTQMQNLILNKNHNHG